MPSLVTQSEVDVFTGDFQNLFDTFKRPIIVWKEPKKTFTTIENNVYVGYGAESVKTNVTYTPQSGQFQAMGLDERVNFCRSRKICFKCLNNVYHNFSTCEFKSRCNTCMAPTHHTLLHGIKRFHTSPKTNS